MPPAQARGEGESQGGSGRARAHMPATSQQTHSPLAYVTAY